MFNAAWRSSYYFLRRLHMQYTTVTYISNKGKHCPSLQLQVKIIYYCKYS